MENSEPKIVYKYRGYDILEFTGRWQVKNKTLLIELKYKLIWGCMYGVGADVIETFADSDFIEWDEVWPIQECSTNIEDLLGKAIELLRVYYNNSEMPEIEDEAAALFKRVEQLS